MEYNLDSFVTSLLDVGANQGHFSTSFKDRYKVKEVVCVEPNPEWKQQLDGLGFETHSVGASSTNEEKTFFINSTNTGSTGNSFYLEQTVHFKQVTELKVNVVRLDDYFYGRTFDFIKIDTQGSEFDAIVGGSEIIKRCKYLLIEVPFFPFNKGAKLASDLIPLIASLGLKPVSFPEFHFAERAHFDNLFSDKMNEKFITHMDILWKNG